MLRVQAYCCDTFIPAIGRTSGPPSPSMHENISVTFSSPNCLVGVSQYLLTNIAAPHLRLLITPLETISRAKRSPIKALDQILQSFVVYPSPEPSSFETSWITAPRLCFHSFIPTASFVLSQHTFLVRERLRRMIVCLPRRCRRMNSVGICDVDRSSVGVSFQHATYERRGSKTCAWSSRRPSHFSLYRASE